MVPSDWIYIAHRSPSLKCRSFFSVQCYGVTVERGYRENSGSDVPVQRGDENEKTRRTRVKVSLIARVHVVLVQVEICTVAYKYPASRLRTHLRRSSEAGCAHGYHIYGSWAFSDGICRQFCERDAQTLLSNGLLSVASLRSCNNSLIKRRRVVVTSSVGAMIHPDMDIIICQCN